MDIFSDILAKLILSRAVNCLKEPIRAELVSQQRLQMVAQRQEKFTRLCILQHMTLPTPCNCVNGTLQ